MAIYGYKAFYETILMNTNMFTLSSSVPLKKKGAACKLLHLFHDLLMGYLLGFDKYCRRDHAMMPMALRGKFLRAKTVC